MKKRVDDMASHIKYVSLILALPLMMIGCATKKDSMEQGPQRPAHEIYSEAIEALQKDKYKEAEKNFDQLEKEYPFDPIAIKAHIMLAYSYYQHQKYYEAVLTLDRFIKLHPSHSDTAYAYYLKALCYYEQIADVQRDAEMTHKAFDALRDVVVRFPHSDYAKDASIKKDWVVNHLAGKEMEIGRYYMRTNQPIAAIKRFEKVVEQYDTTMFIPEALHRMVELYLQLGIAPEAERYGAVLGHNYPNNFWYEKTHLLLEKENVKKTF